VLHPLSRTSYAYALLRYYSIEPSTREETKSRSGARPQLITVEASKPEGSPGGDNWCDLRRSGSFWCTLSPAMAQ